MSARLDELASALGYDAGPSERLRRALTHGSFTHEAGVGEHNERLEFLGDAVVGLLVAEALMEALPEALEGRLSPLRSSIVNEASLAGFARARGLGALLRLGVGEARSGGRDKDSLLADAYEAVIGAVHLDLGIAAARAVVRADAGERIAAGEPFEEARDHKTQLQELCQARLRVTPIYRLLEAVGPDHLKVFTAEVVIPGMLTSQGTGATKKAAERVAAAAARAMLEADSGLRPLREGGGGAPAPAGTESPSPVSPPEDS